MQAGTFSAVISPRSIETAKIDFISPILTVNNHQFSEKIENNGEISNVLILNLSQGRFVAGIDGKISLTGLPNNLERTFVLKDASNIEITLNGKAISHNVRDNLDVAGKYLKFDFKNDLIAFNAENLNAHNVMAPGGLEVREKIELKFLNPALHLDSRSFTERDKNDGMTDTKLNLSIRGGSFVDVIGRIGDISLEGLPSPLIADFSRIDGHNIAVEILGRAISHQERDSFNELAFTFSNALMTNHFADFRLTPIFSANNQENINDKIELTFIDNVQPIAKMSADFSEVDDNDGSIRERVFINLDDDYYSAPMVTTNVELLAPGLKATFLFPNTSQILVELTGHAKDHLDSDDVDNLKFEFTGGEFSSGLTPLDIENARINFLDPVLEINGDTFTESIFDCPFGIL